MDPPGHRLSIAACLPLSQTPHAAFAAESSALTIDRRREHNQAIAADQAWARYYTQPVTVYGGYYGGGWRPG